VLKMQGRSIVLQVNVEVFVCGDVEVQHGVHGYR